MTSASKDVGFETYTKLYYSCVVPVADYCSGVWGFRDFNKGDMIQNRAIRYFLGVHWFSYSSYQRRYVLASISTQEVVEYASIMESSCRHGQ